MLNRLYRRTSTVALGAAVLVFTPLFQARAQEPEPGDRVRVVSPSGSPLVGRFTRRSADSVWLELSDGTSAARRLDPATQLERSLGRKRHIGTGALLGAFVGAIATAGFLAEFCGGDNLCNGDEQVGAAFIFGVPSIVLGAGIGALVRTERWSSVPLGPSGTRLQVGVRLVW